MDDGEVETLDRAVFPKPNSAGNFLASTSVDTFRTCLHTHTCNLPGPDAAHTHTCYHTHTQVIPSKENDGADSKLHSISRPRRRRPSGNREAVRKYREKKKAHAAYLEEEVKKLQLLNQQLVMKLQGQASLEAECLRLRSLLLEFRGKIDSELSAFTFEKQFYKTSAIHKEGDCELQSIVGETGLRCETDLPSFCPPAIGFSFPAGIVGESEKTKVPFGGNCQPPVIDCQDNPNGMASAEVQNLHIAETLVSSATQDK
ncbi:basic leucine zipper 24-like [Argentina anserina]|uniref:basic leucine zipper 24-like n=1 Tax=Argentina anserina TaxID=57926 RepID=UPI0021768BF1|nr:basic leucine zipper 24-like [Potentilla anserina]XP_050385711.1 basic leucine zipper 24-like [Potentilla anserina]XP_050385712.1 basic leucine zipper 24-like [Potentilla anserina]XP_050385713.1 basic leucine zipper 24-like [Potentilla anserina]